MNNRTKRAGLLVAFALVLASGTTWADGRTVAASGKTQTLAFEGVVTLISGLEGTDVCATIINRSEKIGLIEITVTDDAAGTTTAQIERSKSAALCGLDTEAVSLECLGPKKCAFTWSVDRF